MLLFRDRLEDGMGEIDTNPINRKKVLARVSKIDMVLGWSWEEGMYRK